MKRWPTDTNNLELDRRNVNKNAANALMQITHQDIRVCIYGKKKSLSRFLSRKRLFAEREREMKDGSGEVVQLKKTREKLFQLREIRLVNGIGAAPSHFNWTLETLTGSPSVFRPRSSTLEDILYARDDTFDRKIFNTNVRSNISEIRRNISINSNSYGCIKKSRPSSSNIV